MICSPLGRLSEVREIQGLLDRQCNRWVGQPGGWSRGQGQRGSRQGCQDDDPTKRTTTCSPDGKQGTKSCRGCQASSTPNTSRGSSLQPVPCCLHVTSPFVDLPPHTPSPHQSSRTCLALTLPPPRPAAGSTRPFLPATTRPRGRQPTQPTQLTQQLTTLLTSSSHRRHVPHHDDCNDEPPLACLLVVAGQLV